MCYNVCVSLCVCVSYLEKKVQNVNEAAKAASRETKNTINTFPKLQLSPGLFKKKEKV